MSPLLIGHIAAGSVALLAGGVAVVSPKGEWLHIRAGLIFFLSMLALGITATILEWFEPEPGVGAAGLFTVYFVTTSWLAARRRDSRTGPVEAIAAIVALGAAAALFWAGATSTGSMTPVGNGPVFGFGAVCLIAGLFDLRALIARRLTDIQRISRHLWRMLFAFFIATGSFFLGQQQVLPEAMRGTPLQFGLAFAPFGLMLFWLIWVRVSRRWRTRPGIA